MQISSQVAALIESSRNRWPPPTPLKRAASVKPLQVPAPSADQQINASKTARAGQAIKWLLYRMIRGPAFDLIIDVQPAPPICFGQERVSAHPHREEESLEHSPHQQLQLRPTKATAHVPQEAAAEYSTAAEKAAAEEAAPVVAQQASLR